MGATLRAMPAPSAQAYRYDEKSEFTGGLNLRADQFNLAPNESPALLNVEVDPRGGVRRRDAITKINATALTDQIISLFTHYAPNLNQIFASVNPAAAPSTTQVYFNEAANGDFSGPIAYSNGVLTFSGSQPAAGVTFNGYTYIVNGTMLAGSHALGAAIKWNGYNAPLPYDPASPPTSYPGFLSPDLDGSDGHFPCARYVTTWMDHVWAAYTEELIDGTRKNRVRFSKNGDAENWTATDYIDIDVGEDGDHITAIIPDADRLLVFKENSVYAIAGFDRDSWQVRNITRTAGCREGTQPVASTAGVFFWYGEDGVYLLSYDEAVWVFERIKPSMTYDVGQPALTLGTAPSLMWFDERLWVSVDYQSDDNISGSSQTGRRNTFVWDPSLGPTGSWTRHDINARSLLAYRPTGDTHLGVAATSNITTVASFDRISKVDQNADTDTYVDGSVDEINSYYHTGWFIGNRPTFPKRWGKTRTVLLADNNVDIVMYIYKDYDSSTAEIGYSKSIVGLGTLSLWDTAKWDDSDTTSDYYAAWQAEGTSDRYLFARWPTIGTAQAISLRFSVSPTAPKRGKWGVTSVVAMYRTRRLR